MGSKVALLNDEGAKFRRVVGWPAHGAFFKGLANTIGQSYHSIVLL